MHLARRAPAAFAALLLALLAVAGASALGAPAAHAAGTGVDAAGEALRENPVYVDPRARDRLSESDAKALAEKIEDAGKPLFVAVLPATDDYPRKTVLRDLRSRTGITGAYAVSLGTGFNAGADPQVMSRNAVDNLVGQLHRTHGGDVKAELTGFVDQALPQAQGHAPSGWDGGGSGIGTAGAITAGAVVVAGGGGAYALYRRAKKRREERERAELEQLRTVVDEDITAFGEELDRLDFSPSARASTDAMREDYTRALDSYEQAKKLMDDARRPGDVRAVTEALDDGRHALAVLAARRSGAPLPERRLPCFFDPRHGPSTTDVEWAPEGGATRTVPACAADAARIADGRDPQARTVDTEHGPQPYWNAGPAYSPWAGGYFGGMLPGMLIGTALGSMIGGPGLFGGGFGGDGPSGPEGGDASGTDFNPADFGGFGGFGDDSGGFGGGDDW